MRREESGGLGGQWLEQRAQSYFPDRGHVNAGECGCAMVLLKKFWLGGGVGMGHGGSVLIPEAGIASPSRSVFRWGDLFGQNLEVVSHDGEGHGGPEGSAIARSGA